MEGLACRERDGGKGVLGKIDSELLPLPSAASRKPPALMPEVLTPPQPVLWKLMVSFPTVSQLLRDRLCLIDRYSCFRLRPGQTNGRCLVDGELVQID